MKILVTTSDNYAFLLKPYCELFNRYWPGNEIVFLGFDKARIPQLPDNCSFRSLGVQSDFGRFWTDPLIPYIEEIEDEYFVVTVEDMMLTGPVDVNRVKILEDEIKYGEASKAILDTHLNIYSRPYKENIVQLNSKAPYRTTLHPCIWKKEYFKRYLKREYTAWDFEIKNMQESMSDGALIISLADDENLFKSANVYKKGVPFPRWNEKFPWGCDTEIKEEDKFLILQYVRDQGIV
mgnify:CR=1 FL=1